MLAVAHKSVKFLTDVTGKFGLRGDPVLAGRSPVACAYGAAAQLVAFAERETGTTLPV